MLQIGPRWILLRKQGFRRRPGQDRDEAASAQARENLKPRNGSGASVRGEKNCSQHPGDGRDSTRDVGDTRKGVDNKQCVELNSYISSMHEKWQQVFRRTVGGWIEDKHDRKMSNRAVRGLLYRVEYRRRRGRIKIPPMNEPRKARIRRFLVEMAERAFSPCFRVAEC